MVMRLLPIRIAADEVSTPGDVVRIEGAEGRTNHIRCGAWVIPQRRRIDNGPQYREHAVAAGQERIDRRRCLRRAALAAAASLALATGLLGASSP